MAAAVMKCQQFANFLDLVLPGLDACPCRPENKKDSTNVVTVLQGISGYVSHQFSIHEFDTALKLKLKLSTLMERRWFQCVLLYNNVEIASNADLRPLAGEELSMVWSDRYYLQLYDISEPGDGCWAMQVFGSTKIGALASFMTKSFDEATAMGYTNYDGDGHVGSFSLADHKLRFDMTISDALFLVKEQNNQLYCIDFETSDEPCADIGMYTDLADMTWLAEECFSSDGTRLVLHGLASPENPLIAGRSSMIAGLSYKMEWNECLRFETDTSDDESED